MEHARSVYEEDGFRMRVHDREKVNPSHVEAHRRLVLIEDLLVFTVHGLRNGALTKAGPRPLSIHPVRQPRACPVC